MRHRFSRRAFLACGATTLGALLIPTRTARAAGLHFPLPSPHPTPRVGITGAKVLTKEQLAGKPQLVGLFDAVRAIPEVIDGIRCNCGCAQFDSFYSLLSCYEGYDSFAMECSICHVQCLLAVRLHNAGTSLYALRAAVDAHFC